VVDDVVEVVVILDVVVVSVPASDEHAAATRARTIVMASTRRIGHLYSGNRLGSGCGEGSGS